MPLHHRKFILPNTPYFISGSLTGVLDYIQECFTDHPACDALVSKAKWVIIELLTNAIKHSGMIEVAIEITTNENELIIEKTDDGNPLRLPVQDTQAQLVWPLKNIPSGTISVYEDDMHMLYGRIESDCSVTFFAEAKNQEATSFPIENVAEHFGLLIITKSTDSFTYSYDEKTRTNSFKCTINTNIVGDTQPLADNETQV
jgi:anti-sigma regulatory factor (Ser/Thr protein kinase)